MHPRIALVAVLLSPLACSSSSDGDSDAGSAGQSSSGGSTSGSPTTSTPAGTSGASGSDDTTGSASSTTAAGTSSESGNAEASTSSSSGETGAESSSTTGDGTEGTTSGEGGDTTGAAFPDVLDITFIAHNDCAFTVNPPSISVPAGTEFTVNWVSSPASEVNTDIAKIDPFNHVPIVIGHLPGTSYHDDIREWCGFEHTGTFEFRLTSCFDPTYIPVDCDG
jgi:hypothetical protein